jgi:mono/diheme cytochrome c family protein
MVSPSAIGRAGLALACLALVPSARAADDDPKHAVYVRYCGACHGPNAKGDGIAGTLMTPKPPDLTVLAKKNQGEFPFMRVMRVIDGRDTVRAHGDPTMPVWGEVFSADAAGSSLGERIEVQGKLMLLTDYLRSVQEK